MSAPAASASSNDLHGARGSDVFASTIAPMLARNCTPCHVPGGKLYARLPFDKPEVVASHAASMLKRLNSPADKRLLEDWAASQAKAP
jgi:hypothetical protein